jgi:hypothetical protein
MKKYSDFNWNEYLNLNDDLKTIINNKIDAFQHYIKFGINEGRIYKIEVPENFNWQEYLELNPDLIEAKINTKEEAEKHYCVYGKKEKRKYFDNLHINNTAEAYIENLKLQNNDLDLEYSYEESELINSNLLFEEFKNIAIFLHIGSNDMNKINYFSNLIQFNVNFFKQNNVNTKVYIFISDYIENLLTHVQLLFPEQHIEVVPNKGMDIYSFYKQLLKPDFSCDLLIKYHSKTIPDWTMDCTKPFSNEYNILLTLSHLYKNKSIGIIGNYKWLVPAFFGISQSYLDEIKKLLDDFGIEMKYLNFIDYQNKNVDISSISPFRYLDLHNDIHENEIYSSQKLLEHAKWIVNNNVNEFRIGMCDKIINDENITKYIAGTIFCWRGNVIKKAIDKWRDKIEHYIELFETGLVKDGEGTIFRYTHTFERIPGILSQALGFSTKGIEYPNSSISPSQDSVMSYNEFKIKKKIVFVSHDLTKSGAPKILLDIVKKFSSIYECYLIARNGGDLYEHACKIIPSSNVFILMCDNETSFGIPNFVNNISLTSKILQEINPYAIYINSLASSFALFASYSVGIPTIFHAHEALLELINLHKSAQTICYDLGALIDFCICTDNQLKKYLIDVYNISQPEVLYNFTNIFEKVVVDESDTIDIHHEGYDKIIGMAGTICYRKGFDIFIELALQNPSYYFIWAGVGEYDKSLIPENMEVIKLKPTDMIKFYNKLDVFILSTRSDACPLVVIEALYNDTPVVFFEKNVQVYDIAKECGAYVIDGFINIDDINNVIRNDLYKNTKIDKYKINKTFNEKNFYKRVDELIKKCISMGKKEPHKLLIGKTQNKFLLNFNNRLLYDYNEYFTKQKQIKLVPSSHRIAEEYLISNWDLRLNGLFTSTDAYTHYYNAGYTEKRLLYRPPILIAKRMIYIIHSSDFTGAPIVGAEMANYLQEYFDLILLSKNIGPMIKKYVWKNHPIELKNRDFEYGITRYLDRVELAVKILTELKPDIVYVNSSCSEDYAHACKILNIPMLYHGHEGEMGMTSQLNGAIIPCMNTHKNINNIVYYSASPETSRCMYKYLGINSSIKINEFQAINIYKIESKAMQKTDISLKNDDRLLIGMVGSASYRKGLDLFINCAKKYSQYDFVWIGKKDDIGDIVDDKNLVSSNFRFLGAKTNPYPLMKQFDLLLISSREDLFPLVGLESMMLGINICIYKEAVGAWYEFEKLGAIIIEGKPDDDLSRAIETIQKCEKLNTINHSLIKQYDVKSVIDRIVITDVIKLTGGLINNYLREMYWHNRYGYITYDYKKINELIINFYEDVGEFDEDIYKRKYKDVSMIENINLEKHYYKTGFKYGRNCKKFDWKLIIANNISLLEHGVYNQDTLFEYITNNDFDIHNSSKIEFSIEKYKERYQDLKDLTDSELFNHWIKCGVHEGRCCVNI